MEQENAVENTRGACAEHQFVSIGPIRIAIDPAVVSEKIMQVLRSGRYEGQEARIAVSVVEAGDVVLEIGSGLGYISSLLWQTGKVSALHCYEANPALIPLLTTTHRLNGVTSVVENCVLAERDGSTDFFVKNHFWGSSLHRGRGSSTKVVVPVRRFQDVLGRVRPTLIIMDIEGGEVDVFDGLADLSMVRSLMMEIHPQATGLSGVMKLFASLARLGFAYDARHSRGKVVVFINSRHHSAATGRATRRPQRHEAREPATVDRRA